MQITDIPMTRPRYSPGRPYGPPRLIVLHSTAGSWPGDLHWLQQGGGADPAQAVSIHYLISPAGEIIRLVPDLDTAWHTGPSAWRVDGELLSGSVGGVAALNWRSIGIELSHPNRANVPYSAAQIAAATTLTQRLVAAYAIPRSQLVRHLDISPGRKTDPAGFPWETFVSIIYAAAPVPEPPSAPYSADSPVMGPPRGTTQQAIDWLTQRTRHYDRPAVTTIVAEYARVGAAVGLDWFLALAQCAHETGNLTSALSARPIRNPAGIGVTGASSAIPQPGYVWDADRSAYRAAVTFPAWTEREANGAVSSVEAHLGRLLAYALPPGQRFGPQVSLVDRALSVRGLSLLGHGTAPTLKALGRAHNPQGHIGMGWASPGDRYGEAIAALANRMRGL